MVTGDGSSCAVRGGGAVTATQDCGATAVRAVYRRDARPRPRRPGRTGHAGRRRGGRAERLRGVALRTPLLAFGPTPTDPGGPRAWLKAESLQPIGAFKIRGAYNALAQLSRSERAAGVVAHSSGNHAQGVARRRACWASGRSSSCPATRRPSRSRACAPTAPRSTSSGRTTRSASRAPTSSRSATAWTLVPSFDDAPHRGRPGHRRAWRSSSSCARWAARAGDPSRVLVPIGGGGLSAGVCVAVKGLRPDARVFGVEPELAADAADSLRQGRIVRWAPELTGRTIADGVRSERPRPDPVRAPAPPPRRGPDRQRGRHQGRRMLEAAPPGAHRRRAVRRAARGGLARATARSCAAAGDIVIVVSGGNVDADRYRRLLEEAAALG